MGSLLGDVKDVLKDVVSLASSVLKLGGTWYHASEALEEFKRNVADLERTCKVWQSRAHNYGLSSDTILRLSLEMAKEQLQLEEARLKKLDKGCGCLSLWLCLSSETDFPVQLGKTIVDLDNTITTKWKADDAVEDALWKRAEVLARSPSFTFTKDRRYVRLPLIEEQIKATLNNESSGDESVRVVLLYGRAGSGKSSMARNLALGYKRVATLAVDPCASDSAYWRRFDNVLYVECGPQAELKVKQGELFHMLAWRSSDADQEKYKDSEKVKPMLKQMLKDSHSLIIFDDVWEELFLKEMVGVCGEHVRVLVTSQREYLCRDSLSEETKSVCMDQITGDDSLRILRAHTGFKDDETVTEGLQKCMDQLVAKVCGHPHALASVSVAIDPKYKRQEWQWENAIREYEQLLKEPFSKVVANPVHGVQYEMSFTEAIQMKFRRLHEEELKLLVLMVMFEGPSIGEELLQLFHAELIVQDKAEGVRSCRSFSEARKRLEDLQCIKISPEEFRIFPLWGRRSVGEQGRRWGNFEIERQCWFIHSLDEAFIKERMKNDITAMLKATQNLPYKKQGLETEHQVHVIQLLGLLFFRPPFSGVIEKHLLNPLNTEPFSLLPRRAVVPIVQLMAKNVGKDWSKTSQQSSDQIFLSCITKRTIHNAAARELLNSLVSKQEVWALIRQIDRDVKWSIDEDVIVGVLEMFGDLKSSFNSPIVGSFNSDQWSALMFLVSRWQWNPASSCSFGMKKLVLDLTDTLTSPSCPQERKHLSAVTLSYLVPSMYSKPSEYAEEEISKIPRIIERLFQSFRETTESKAREEAILALYTLAGYSKENLDVKQKMISILGFNQLVSILGREEDLYLEQLAALTLTDLVLDKSTGRYHKGIQISASVIDSFGGYLTMEVAASESVEKDVWRVGHLLELLMHIDPLRGKSMVLNSSVAFETRGKALAELGQDQDAVSDLDKARQLSPTSFTTSNISWRTLIDARRRLKDWEGLIKDYDHQIGLAVDYEYLSSDLPDLHKQRGILRRKRGDLSGALDDLNKSLQLHPHFLTLMQRAYVKVLLGDKDGARADVEEEASQLGFDANDEDFFYQERGVAKRMMEDLPGALKDLDKSLQLGPNDYEVLKQRGYLKFLMGDKEGARVDAKEALRFRPSQVDEPGCDHDSCLGASIVEFLDFRL